MPSRRTLLRITGVCLIPFAGCVNRSGSPVSTETSNQSQPKTNRSTSASSTSTPLGAFPPLYFSEILSNPEGEDSEKLSEEYIVIEKNAQELRNLSNYTLEYGEKHRYSFPDLVSEVELGATLTIRSGSGENRVEGSEYSNYLLFVGSKQPLLDNDGMQLSLRDSRGELVDSVTYRNMGEGTLWVKPE